MKKLKRTAALFTAMYLALALLYCPGAEAASARLSRKKLTLKTGQSYKLRVINFRKVKSGKNIKWSSTNKKVVTVSRRGKVKAKSAGGAVVKAVLKKKKGKKYKKYRTLIVRVKVKPADTARSNAPSGKENTSQDKQAAPDQPAHSTPSTADTSGAGSTAAPTSPSAPAGGDCYTRGEWIHRIAEKLSMTEDRDESARYYGDTLDNKYGDEEEMAHVFGLVPESDNDGYKDPENDVPLFEEDKTVTNEYAAYTLVNALGFEVNGSDEMEVAEDQNLVTGEASDPVTKEAGDKMLDRMQEIIDSARVDEDNQKDEVTYQDDVVTKEQMSDTDYTVTDNNDGTYTATVSKNDETEALDEGSVFVLPENDTNKTPVALKVSDIDSDSGDDITLECTEPEIDEVFSDVNVEMLQTFSLSDDTKESDKESGDDASENAVSDEDTADQSALEENVTEEYSEPLRDNQIGRRELARPNSSSGSKKKDKDDNLKVYYPDAKIKVSTDDFADALKGGDTPLDIKAKAALELSEIGIKFRMSDPDNTTLYFTNKFDIDFSLKFLEEHKKAYITDTDGNVTSVEDTKELMTNGLSIPLGHTGFTVDLTPIVTYSASGEMSLGFTSTFRSGVQTVNGSVRVIHDFSASPKSLELKGTAKAGLGIRVSLALLSTIDIIAFDNTIGLKGTGKFTYHYDDNVYCGDFRLTMFVLIKLSDHGIIGDLLDRMNVDLELELVNENNSPIDKHIHFENGKEVNVCRYNSDFSIDENGELISYSGNDSVVTIPRGVTVIGESAFSGCKSITNLIIPEGVTQIGRAAFWDCENLVNIKIPKSVKYIVSQAFLIVQPPDYTGPAVYIPWMTNLRKNNSMVIINDILVDGTSCQGTVKVPDGIRLISEAAFMGCQNLEKVIIPDSATEIGDYAFANCENLTDISIPKSVKKFGYDSFSSFDSCKDIHGAIPWLKQKQKENPLVVINDVLIDGTTCGEQAEIPYGVKIIGDCSFFRNSQLKRVDIPESVSIIGKEAFLDCESLEDVYIPDSVNTIIDGAFSGCSALSNIKIPDSVTYIDLWVFADCSNLRNVELPDKLISIGANAFYECSELLNLKIPAGVEAIDESAFYDVPGITYSGNATYDSDDVFWGAKSMNGIPNNSDQ